MVIRPTGYGRNPLYNRLYRRSSTPRQWLAVAALGLALACLGACDGSTGKDSLVFVFQKQKKPQDVEAHARRIGEILSDALGRPVKTQVPLHYALAVQALVSNKADVAYLDSLAYLLARRDGDVELLLAEVRPDVTGLPRTDYDSIMVVRADSPLQSFEDFVEQAPDLRFVFTSELSTSGYLMPMRRFVQEGMLEAGEDPGNHFKSADYAGGYSQALQQVVDGRGDVCAVSYYTMEGPRADVYMKAEERSQLRILARIPGVPTHVICIRSALDPALKDSIRTALLDLGDSHTALLADVYGAKALTRVNEEEHLKAAVEALAAVGQSVDKFVKK